MRPLEPEREVRFRALYADAYGDVLRFAQRRVHPSHAEDVTADTFLVVWRRLDDAPNTPDDVRAWLFGIARHCLLNTRRGEGRRDALAVRVAEAVPAADWENGLDADLVAQRIDLAAAWRRLRATDQEALSLTVFENLSSPQAACVLCITPVSYRLRLLRARRALRRQLDLAESSRPCLIPVPAAAVALIVGSMLVQGGNGGGAAYASWTGTPSPVASQDFDTAASACRGKLQRDDTIDGDRARLVLSERRGDHVALLYRTDDPDLSAACLVHVPQGSTDVDTVDLGVAGSMGPALEAPPTGFTQGAVFEYDYGASSITDGAVGEAVTGVTIHAGAFTVQATVENGRYAAWWPGPAFESGPSEPSGEAGPALILTYDLTLSDGTVIHNAQPTTPS